MTECKHHILSVEKILQKDTIWCIQERHWYCAMLHTRAQNDYLVSILNKMCWRMFLSITIMGRFFAVKIKDLCIIEFHHLATIA